MRHRRETVKRAEKRVLFLELPWRSKRSKQFKCRKGCKKKDENDAFSLSLENIKVIDKDCIPLHDKRDRKTKETRREPPRRSPFKKFHPLHTTLTSFIFLSEAVNSLRGIQYPFFFIIRCILPSLASFGLCQKQYTGGRKRDTEYTLWVFNSFSRIWLKKYFA